VTTTQTNPRLAAALVYAALGWPVVPLHTPTGSVCDCPRKTDCASPGKHPRTLHGLEDATTDEASIRRWWSMWPHANIAIDLARSSLVDIAPDSLEWFAEFVARGLPPTLRFASGAGEGHLHFLYARPAGCANYRIAESGQYDLLSAGYAVMPPSLHASGREYAWLEPAGVLPITPPVEPAPAWAVDMLNARRHTVSGEPRTDEDLEDEPPVSLSGPALQRWLGQLCEHKPDGSVDRSYSLWWLAVVLLEAGCKPRFVEQLLAERDVVLGWTKFSGRRDAHVRYRIIVARARASQGPKRIRVDGAAHGPRTRQRRRTAQWFTAEGISDMEDEQIGWSALGLLGIGLITELDGKVKQSGKTTFVLAMVRAILESQPFLGQTTSYSPILYLTEQSAPSFKRNLRRAGLLEREDLHVLLWSYAIGWKWEHVVAEAQSKAAEVGAKVLIVDTLGQFSGIRGDTENNSGTAMVVMEPLQSAAAGGLAVLVTRHDRKSGGDVGDSGRGSSAYAGTVDIVLHLQRLQGNHAGRERQRLVEGISRFEETPDKLLIELGEGEPHTYSALGDVDVLREQSLRREILACLPTNPDDALSTTELKEIIAVSPNDLLRVLGELIREGMVRRLGAGKKGDPYRYYQRVFDDDD
jgi:hypothetical protein